MKQFFTLLTALTILSFTSQAQKAGKVSGTVVDGSQKTIEAATISLLKANDSSTVKFTVATKEGGFRFDEVAEGAYLVSITAVGHQKGFSPRFEITAEKPQVKLATIELIPVAKSMGAVTVTARKPFIEQKIDRTVINVEASITNAGATAYDVLEKSPGVTMDKDGNISLKGKQGITVMIDGRPSYISGADLVNYLKGLPASAIDQIEIMTNPPAKYDAAGNSGIINIKQKKNRQSGFNGSLTASYQQGRYWKTNNSLNLNYRNGKFNVFANGSVNKGNGFTTLDILRKFKDGTTKDITAIFQQTSHMRNQNWFNNAKIGVDYYASKKTTLGVVVSGFVNPGNFSSRNTSYLQDRSGTVDSIVSAQSNMKGDWKNGSVNLNMRHQFDSTGRELTTDLDYITYRSMSDQTFSNNTFSADWKLKYLEELRGSLPVNVNIYSAKVDYTQPLAKEAKLEAGLKTSHVNTDNEANYFTVTGNRETVDYSKTNHFNYTEDIRAAYLNVNKQFKKVGMQLGLRYEQTSYSGKQSGNPTRTDSSFKRTYGNLFPTAFISYNAGKNNQFGLSFGRRIDRPAYQDLNPFLFFLDKFTYQAGNPYLKPQFTNNIELSHTFRNVLTTTLNYSHTVDYKNETFEQEKDVNGNKGYATIVRNGNIGKKDGAGISVSAQLNVRKWWSAQLYTNYNYTRFNGRLNGNGEYINIDAANLLFNVNNQFHFAKGWAAELGGFYRTKGVEGQIIIQPMGQMSGGISKQVLNGKGTVKFNVRDMLYSNFPKGDINFENTEAHFENRRDSRVANVTFTYRFGKPLKGTQPRRKIGGADEEQNRVKAGGNN